MPALELEHRRLTTGRLRPCTTDMHRLDAIARHVGPKHSLRRLNGGGIINKCNVPCSGNLTVNKTSRLLTAGRAKVGHELLRQRVDDDLPSS